MMNVHKRREDVNSKTKDGLRRSQRLSFKRQSEVFSNNSEMSKKPCNTMHEMKISVFYSKETSLGLFDLLPMEVTFNILHKIPVLELSILTMCSKNMRDVVKLYVSSVDGSRHLSLNLKPDFKDKTVLNYRRNMKCFQTLGLLLKRMTFLYPTKQRIQVMMEVIKKARMTTLFPFKNSYLRCFGHMAQTIIAGWEKPECRFANECLLDNSGMDKLLLHVLGSSPGSNPSNEKTVRNFFRYIYFDLCRNSERGFWLTTILKPYPYIYQAKLLFIIFGPLNDEKILWFTDEIPTFSTYELRNLFVDLAVVFKTLHKEKDWNSDEVLSLLKELTSIPFLWTCEITACFLHSCGDDISLLVMTNLLTNGRLINLTSLIITHLMICDRLNYDMNGLVDNIEKLCKIRKNKKDVVRLIKMLPAVLIDNNLMDTEDGFNGSLSYDFEEAQKKFFSIITMRAFNVKDNFHSKLHEE